MNEGLTRFCRGQIWRIKDKLLLIISGDAFNMYESSMLCIPIGVSFDFPTHVPVEIDGSNMAIECEKLYRVDKEEFKNGQYEGFVSKMVLRSVEVSVGEVVGIDLYENGLRKPLSDHNKWSKKKFLEFKKDVESGMFNRELSVKYNLAEKSVKATYNRLKLKYEGEVSNNE